MQNFSLLHSVLQGQTCLLLQVSLDLWVSNCSKTICWNGILSSIKLLLHLSEKSLWALVQPYFLAPCSLGSRWHEYQLFCHSPAGPRASLCVCGSLFLSWHIFSLLLMLGHFYGFTFPLFLPFYCWTHHWAFTLITVVFTSKISICFFFTSYITSYIGWGNVFNFFVEAFYFSFVSRIFIMTDLNFVR